MHIIGYLITLSHLQFAQDQAPLKDLAVRVSQVKTLYDELLEQDEFPIEGFRSMGYQRQGNVGKFLSKTLRDYIFEENVDPEEEGLILTLDFSDDPTDPNMSDMSLFVQKGAKFKGEIIDGVLNDYLNHIRG